MTTSTAIVHVQSTEHKRISTLDYACDHCGAAVRGENLWTNRAGSLRLCDHCSRKNEPALIGAGWTHYEKGVQYDTFCGRQGR